MNQIKYSIMNQIEYSGKYWIEHSGHISNDLTTRVHPSIYTKIITSFTINLGSKIT